MFQRISFFMVAERSSETLVSYHITIWSHKPEDLDLNTSLVNPLVSVFANIINKSEF
jgi:hypothetical protein